MGFSFSLHDPFQPRGVVSKMQSWNPSVALGSVAPTTHCASLVKALTKRLEIEKGPPGKHGREPPRTPRNYGSDPERASGGPVIPSESGLCVHWQSREGLRSQAT